MQHLTDKQLFFLSFAQVSITRVAWGVQQFFSRPIIMQNFGNFLFTRIGTLDDRIAVQNGSAYFCQFGPNQQQQVHWHCRPNAFYDICSSIRDGGWQKFGNMRNNSVAVYAVSPVNNISSTRTWVGYDDFDTVRMKGEYVRKNGLGGAAVWDLSQDDFLNKCGNGPYVLTHSRQPFHKLWASDRHHLRPINMPLV
jgi:hypothetical protein